MLFRHRVIQIIQLSIMSNVIKYTPRKCPLCNHIFMNLSGQPLKNHHQVKCQLEDKNTVYIAICEDCIERGIVTVEKCQKIFEGIKEYWVQDINRSKNLNEDGRNKVRERHQKMKISKIISNGNNSIDNARNILRKQGAAV